MRFSMRVVFPLPRNPVMMVTGVGVMIAYNTVVDFARLLIVILPRSVAQLHWQAEGSLDDTENDVDGCV